MDAVSLKRGMFVDKFVIDWVLAVFSHGLRIKEETKMNKFNIHVGFVADSVFGCCVMYVNHRTFNTKLLPVHSWCKYRTCWWLKSQFHIPWFTSMSCVGFWMTGVSILAACLRNGIFSMALYIVFSFELFDAKF